MSHFFVVACNENGIVTDQYISDNIQKALDSPFEFTDIFIYSHGWWNTANRATQDYNRFTLEFAKSMKNLIKQKNKVEGTGNSLGIGIYWPSMLSADPDAFFNTFQAASFYTMEKRADAVGEHAGYMLLQQIASSKKPPKRLTLLGHSFGCKVVCNALQTIQDDKVVVESLRKMAINLVLIQGALDSDHMEKGDAYGDISKVFPDLRVLATLSSQDLALSKWYPAAQLAKIVTIFSQRGALGSQGPSAKVAKQYGGLAKVSIHPGSTYEATHKQASRFVLCDISPLHTDPNNNDKFSGHHSDIFHEELYEAIIGFISSK